MADSSEHTEAGLPPPSQIRCFSAPYHDGRWEHGFRTTPQWAHHNSRGFQMQWLDSFATRKIVDTVASLRVRDAQNAHTRQLLQRLGGGKRRSPPIFSDCTPPRRAWPRPRRAARISLGTPLATANALSQRMLSELLLPAGRRKPWADRLAHFDETVRALAASPAPDCIGAPRVYPIQKDHKELIYRPLAIYSPQDRALIGHAARYLRTAFDPIFRPESYAFRAPSDGSRPPRHHDAFAALVDYRAARPSRALWVAECDISAFYDTVSHQVAQRSFELAAQRVTDRGDALDERARVLFDAYLASYSFTVAARPAAAEFFRSRQLSGAVLKWPEKQLSEYWISLESVPIGIPQGGAISCVIANLVLHMADEAVLGSPAARDPDLFYARYCDDMIVAHPSRSECNGALARYLATLERLALPYHAPEATPYSATHWKSKSKWPYRWGPRCDGDVPWVAFVGYQLRHDGVLRIRPSSLQKHATKLVRETTSAIAALERRNWTSRDSRASVLARVEGRLLSLSTGRVPLGLHQLRRGTFCWTDGFHLLRHAGHIAGQLRRLDRIRTRQLRRLRRRLRQLTSRPSEPRRGQRRALKYRGYPFSYAYQFAPRVEPVTEGVELRSPSNPPPQPSKPPLRPRH
jgi:hypothetical protein